jgi:hypothetical protein
VCKTSGLIPTNGCPEIEVREFRKGKEPERLCAVHSAVVRFPVCPESHLLPGPDCPPVEMVEFPVGMVPTAQCPQKRLSVCRESGMLAGPNCPDVESKVFFPPLPDVPCSVHGKVVCKHPYSEESSILIWSGTRLCGLSLLPYDGMKETELPGYYDALAQDGVNAERNFSCFLDTDDLWRGLIPWNGDDLASVNEAYYAQALGRMRLAAARKLTEVVTVGPYSGYHLRGRPDFPAYVRNFVRRTKPLLPYIVYETWNEPGDGTEGEEDKTRWSEMMVDIFLSEGIPPRNIMVPFADCGMFADLLVQKLQGKGLGSLHWVGSMETILEAEHPWEGSPGTMGLMLNGLIGSNDGEDVMRKSLGLNWFELEQAGNVEFRRPNVPQLRAITAWMTGVKEFQGSTFRGRGYEQLSAAGCQRQVLPRIYDAIETGRAERRAMAEAVWG